MIYLGKKAEPGSIPDCRVVVVNRNTRDLLARCLESLGIQGRDLHIEVVVADAGSTDGSTRLVKDRFPGVKLVELDDNPGYSSSINRAAEGALAKYLLIMNSDVQLLEGALLELASFMDVEPGAGAAGPRLLNPDGTAQRSFNRKFPGLGSALSYALGISSLRERLYRVNLVRRVLGALLWKSRVPRKAAWVGGACLIVRREVFENIGRMDERYFLYSEDTDLCRRMVKGGHSVWYVPSSRALHHWNSSIGKLTDSGFLSSQRSSLMYHRIHTPHVLNAVKVLMFAGTAVRLSASVFARMIAPGREALHRRTWLYWGALEIIAGRPVREKLKGMVGRVWFLSRRVLLAAAFPSGHPTDGSNGLPGVKKILVIRYDGLGDMVLTIPFIRMLKQAYPAALIYVLASSANSGLLVTNPDIYQAVMAPCGGVKGKAKLVKRLMSEYFDLVIDPLVTHSLGSALLSRLVGCRYRCGFTGAGRERFFNVTPPSGDPDSSVLESLTTLAKYLGFKGPAGASLLEGSITVSRKSRAWVERRFADVGISPGDPVLGVHPGGRYESQRWPMERFLRVAFEVHRREKIKVVLFQGSEWKARLELHGPLPEGIVILEDTGLEHFIAAVGRLTLLLCNNSGPLHVARALGTPTISITGPTRKAFLPEVDQLHRMIELPLNCRPCDKPLCQHHSCILSIDTRDVTAMTIGRLRETAVTAESAAFNGTRSWKGKA